MSKIFKKWKKIYQMAVKSSNIPTNCIFGSFQKWCSHKMAVFFKSWIRTQLWSSVTFQCCGSGIRDGRGSDPESGKSVADPGCFSRFRIRPPSIPDPGSATLEKLNYCWHLKSHWRLELCPESEPDPQKQSHLLFMTHPRNNRIFLEQEIGVQM